MTKLKAVVFDLDETLVHERGTAERVVYDTCLMAQAEYDVDPADLQASVFEEARRHWYAHPIHPFCHQIGVSSWEGLWGRFEGEGPDLAALREWAPEYRVRAWASALAVHGIHDDALARELADEYPRARRKHHIVFPDAEPVLLALKQQVRLGILTNGASDMQREKLAGAGLAHHFDAFVAAGDVRTRKPEPDGFRRVLDLLDVAPEEAAMVGDGLESDIRGACAVGIRAIWVNRRGTANETDVAPDVEIDSLTRLPEVLGLSCEPA